MDELISRMRAAREKWVDIGGFKLKLRRPTDYQVACWRRAGADELALIRDCVVDWSGVLERDLVPSGASEPVAFDPAVLCEWISDKIDIFSEVLEKLSELIEEHKRLLDEDKKN